MIFRPSGGSSVLLLFFLVWKLSGTRKLFYDASRYGCTDFVKAATFLTMFSAVHFAVSRLRVPK
jgi:hypothetical protein